MCYIADVDFVMLGENVGLNLGSVASVSWEDDGGALVAIVKYLLQSSGGQQLVSEKLTGDAAYALRELLEKRTASAQDSDSNSPDPFHVAGKAKNLIPESLEMLVAPPAKKKAWYYLNVNARGYFLAMVNMKGSCSMRTFDADTGKFLGKRYADGNFQEKFRPSLRTAKEVAIDRQPNLERDCRVALPENVLSDLKGRLLVEP